MIRDEIRRAWARSPWRVIGSVLLVPVAVGFSWLITVLVILAWQP